MSPHRQALVVGKFAPLHLGHQRLLDHAQSISDRVIVILWSQPDFDDMPNEVRAAWIRDLYPTATVIAANDGPPNNEPDRVHHEFVTEVLARNGLEPGVVLSGESYGPEFARHLGVQHVAVARDDMPAWTGTTVRADVHMNRHLMDPRVYRHFVDKVAFLGAESTGKSTLTERMALEMDTAHVPEYGREHYEKRQGELVLADYVAIAQIHRAREDELALTANRYLFVDTNAATTMFFSHYYNRDSLPELRLLADQCRDRYRHVIVCDDDIPFEQDGWRDNAVWRSRMQGMVLHDLAVRGIAFSVVSGTLDDRVAQVKAVLGGAQLTRVTTQRSLGPRTIEPT